MIIAYKAIHYISVYIGCVVDVVPTKVPAPVLVCSAQLLQLGGMYFGDANALTNVKAHTTSKKNAFFML